MIARLEGVLVERDPTRVLIDVGGVGYEALIPLSTYSRLPDPGKTVALRIHTHVREDAFLLFGFATEVERAVFGLLLMASRVGPKLAQTILSGMEAEGLAEAIRGGDVSALRQVPGVGPKMAERIVVELRDRVDEVLAGAAPAGPAPAAGPREDPDGPRTQLISALMNLQVPKARAERVSDEVLEAARSDAGEPPGIEELVRAALRRLAR
ncbi:MAG: Holliday junction branch migration protein RuvA [Myxococcota bacterium]|nr:Holliday junction branch migration protein RuvA [Myxococcota bacterium]